MIQNWDDISMIKYHKFIYWNEIALENETSFYIKDKKLTKRIKRYLNL